jgi:hypothetical protein
MNEDFNNEMVELLKSKDITREELGAAYLTFFFKAKLTQTGLSCAIELFNITSPIQLPASFDCLINIILKKEKLMEYNKTWYCGYCLKLIDQLIESSQRNCVTCNTRYYLNIYLSKNRKLDQINF